MAAVALACEVAKRTKGMVYCVHVIEVKRSLPLDAEMPPETAEGERILEEAQGVAKQRGAEIEGEILQARDAAHAIVDEAVERGVDVIVMGKSYGEVFGEFEVGRIVEYVLKNAPCEVWVRRLPAQE
jgi:CIC family chloride channel protein